MHQQLAINNYSFPKPVNEPASDSDSDLHSDTQTSLHQFQTQQTYLMDPHEYLSWCQKDKKIKVMDQCNPILPHVYLKDISLHKKGPLEDKIYSRNNLYYCNIRRGNTLCQIYNSTQPDLPEQSKQQPQLFMCRRGMKKFYDLEPEYLKVGRKLTRQHQRYRHRIFEKVDRALEQGNSVHLYGLFKENGQHCQIGYVSVLGYWLFASKNVAILAKSVQDLDKNYQKERFYWAKLIGREFFRVMQAWSQGRKQEFIRDIEGKTLLGEHCGNEQHQHITKYDKVQIIFYGLVDNNGKDHCLPVQQCEELLKKYNLPMSKMHKVLNLKQKNKVYSEMYKMLKQVAEGTMEENGEGSVLYIVAQDQHNQQTTIGMCKLKTCQYLIYRRMREMIKIYFAKKGSTANNFNKFKFDIENLCQAYFKPPKPLQYYEQIAEQAFDEVRKNGKQFSDNEFRYRFVKFLQNIQARANNRQKNTLKDVPKKILILSPPLLAENSSELEKFCRQNQFAIDYTYRQAPNTKNTKTTVYLLHILPRIVLNQLQNDTIIITYQMSQEETKKVVNELEESKDFKKGHLITFVKSQNKPKTIELLKQKIVGFAKTCSQCPYKKFEYVPTLTFQEVIRNLPTIKKMQNNQQGNNQVNKKGRLFVIVTFLIPGSGKSTIASKLQQLVPQPSKMTVISSDKIRQSIMQKLSDKNKGKISTEQLFSLTKKKGLQKYKQAINEALGQCPPDHDRILLVDRIFCAPTALQCIQQLVRPWTKIILVSQTQKRVKLNQYMYPNSLTYLLTCIKRSLQRQNHQTLSQQPAQIVRILLKFYQMSRTFTLARLQRQLQQAKIEHDVLTLDFVQENEQADNLHLKKKVEECLKGLNPGFEVPESPLHTELIELIYKYSDHIEDPRAASEQYQQACITRNAEQLLKICR